MTPEQSWELSNLRSKNNELDQEISKLERIIQYIERFISTLDEEKFRSFEAELKAQSSKFQDKGFWDGQAAEQFSKNFSDILQRWNFICGEFFVVKNTAGKRKETLENQVREKKREMQNYGSRINILLNSD